MIYKQLDVDSALKKITRKDNLFCGDYTIDPYQNCGYGCIYCDSSIDKKIFIKHNIGPVLEKEFKKYKWGNIIVGSVNDPYQEIEKKEKKTQEILELIKEYNFGCHILTKSELILRDIPILKKIDNCRVTLSITTVNSKKKKLFEKKLPSTDSRLNTLQKLNKNKIKTGLALMPLIPYFVEGEIEEIIKQAKKNHAKYFLYKYLELKGEQKHIFLKKIEKIYPELIDVYQNLFLNSYLPKKDYTNKVDKKIRELINKYNLRNRIC